MGIGHLASGASLPLRPPPDPWSLSLKMMLPYLGSRSNSTESQCCSSATMTVLTLNAFLCVEDDKAEGEQHKQC